jgi:hypothetical protein
MEAQLSHLSAATSEAKVGIGDLGSSTLARKLSRLAFEVFFQEGRFGFAAKMRNKPVVLCPPFCRR